VLYGTAQPGGNHDASGKGQERRNELQRPRPVARHPINPEKHQIRGLGVGHDAMDDPGIGVGTTAGERQQKCDDNRFGATQ